mmetsp:Transcript_16554/g.43492  ORF Transcript_16554/g.43492 Transcript_16554/m.43492 type:complete len:403 (-) Transcript_16554:1275-2483(-)
MIEPRPMTNFSSFCSPLPMIAFEPISHSWELSISRTVSPFWAALASVELTSVGPPPSPPLAFVAVLPRAVAFFGGAFFLAGGAFFAGGALGGGARAFLELASWSFLASSSANFFVLRSSFSLSASSRFFVSARVSISWRRASTFGSRGLIGAVFSFFAVLRGAVFDLRVADFDRSAPFDFLTCRCVVLDRGLLFSFADAFLREARSLRGPWHDSNSSNRACSEGTSKPELMVQTPGSFSRKPNEFMRSKPPGTILSVDSNFWLVACILRFLSSFGSCKTFFTYVTANSTAPDQASGSPLSESTALLTAAMSGTAGRSRVFDLPSNSCLAAFSFSRTSSGTESHLLPSGSRSANTEPFSSRLNPQACTKATPPANRANFSFVEMRQYFGSCGASMILEQQRCT